MPLLYLSGQAGPADAADRDPAVQRAVRVAADADPGGRADDHGRAGGRVLPRPARVHARRRRHRRREVAPRCASATSTTSGASTSSPGRTRPLPWINYLGSEDYFGIISNTAGGYSFYRDARLRRLTRYRYNNAPLDLGGRYLYLRDDADGAVLEPDLAADAARARRLRVPPRPGLHDHRLAASRHPRRDHATSCRSARPSRSGASRVTNERPGPARLSLFGTVEFCLWDAQDDATNFQRNYSIGEVEVEDGVIYHKTEYRERRDHFAYFACSERVGRLRHVARRLPRAVPRLGPADRRRARGVDRTRSPTAGSRSARTRSRLELAARRDARGRLRARAMRRTRPTPSSTRRARRRSTSAASARSSRATSSRRSSSEAFAALRRSLGRAAGRRSRSRPATSTSTGWSTSGTPTSAWSRSTCRARRRCSSPASAAGWASATRTRTCSASSTWCRSGPASGSSTSPPRSCRAAAPTTSTSR